MFERYIELVKSINRPGIDNLVDYLTNKCDMRVAPASTKYHGNFEGGLVQHTLEVYDLLCKLVADVGLEYDPDTLKIAALFHDMAKINLYEKTAFNKKVYSPSGSKRDEVGNFDWVSEPGYKTKPLDERFVYSNHEATSEFIIRQFIPLKIEESAAILHHHFALGYDSIKDAGVVSDVAKKYPLVILLHCADSMCAMFKC